MAASEHGDEDLIQLLLEAGANIALTDSQGLTFVEYIVKSKNIGLIDKFVRSDYENFKKCFVYALTKLGDTDVCDYLFKLAPLLNFDFTWLKSEFFSDEQRLEVLAEIIKTGNVDNLKMILNNIWPERSTFRMWD